MRGFIVEGGIYFLLVFTPFAFGGVEGWALGVIQGVAGVVFVAWAWGVARSTDSSGTTGNLRLLWIAIALFVLLVSLQLTPLPPGVIRSLSPSVYDLYATTLPGYAEGRSFTRADLPPWLVGSPGDRTPAVVDPNEEAAVLHPPMPASEPVAYASAWRTLSIYPFQTRQRLALLISLIAIFAVVVGHFRTKERLSRLLGVTVFSGFAVSLFGMLQKFNWNGKLYWIREGDYTGPFGPFVDRNTYAAFAGTVLPIALCATFFALRQLGEGRRDALPLLLFHGFAAVTLIGGIFYSLSRGGMISTTFSILVIAGLLLYYGRSTSEIGVLGGILVLSATFLAWIGPEKVIQRVGTLAQGSGTPTLALRIVAWKHSMGLIYDHIAIGTGLGTFPYSFMRYAPAGRNWWNIAHNEYIELICDTGLVGGAIFATGLAAWLRLVWRPELFRGHHGRYAYAGIVAGLAALLLHSCVTSNLQVPANSLLLVVLGAALVSFVARQESRNNSVDGAPSGRLRRHRGEASWR